ncbi:MAG: transposase [Candidatus Epulonipiscium fishelsonii]|nr:MAG: transposase [Epulopiscium sp. AS2M-Bin002]
MNDFFMVLTEIEDPRQFTKVKYPLNEIVGLVLMATLGNANEWTEIEAFCKLHQKCLKKYFKLENGIPSHDTFNRVMGMIEPVVIQGLQKLWNEYISTEQGESIKKILSIDGKTMKGSRTENKKALHIVSAWCDEEGICFGQKAVDEKHNEIVAIPELLDEIQIKGYVITIDAMGTQIEIAKKITDKRGDYILALKGNQGALHEDVRLYFGTQEFKDKIKTDGNYKKTIDKQHSQTEIREYYQTKDIKWLNGKDRWSKLKSIGMIEKTIIKKGVESKETRYYISSLMPNIELFEKGVRGHWSVEVMHWHLDVTFREDSNKTVDMTANKNMNIIRKWALSILKLLDMGKPMSGKLKRFSINCRPDLYIDKLMLI